MRINRSIFGGLVFVCFFPAVVSGQSFWFHKLLRPSALGSGGQFGCIDSGDCVLLQGSPEAAVTRNYWNSWNYIFQDTVKRGNIDYEYNAVCLVHPTRNLIMLGCDNSRTEKWIDASGHHYVYGGGHILRSTDAGVTWKDTALNFDTLQSKNPIGAMAALDSNHIFLPIDHDYLPSDSDHFLHSSDGGVTWQSIPCPIFTDYGGTAEPGAGYINPSATYPAPNTLVIAELTSSDMSTIYRSTNLGITWDSEFQTKENITKFFFLNSLVGFASGIVWNEPGPTLGAGTIEKTTDGGQTWNNILTRNGSGLFSIAFADSIHGIACGYFGLILRTTDGGATWTPMVSDFTADYQGNDRLSDVAYPDTNHAMIASSDGSVLVYNPSGILSLPNTTYPLFTTARTPQTFDITWDPVPNATRYSVTVTTSGYPDSNTTLVAKDTNVLTTFYHLSDLADTSPGQPGRQYQIYLQAFNASNKSNAATRLFDVVQSSNGVVLTPEHLEPSSQPYPNPASNWVAVQGFSGSETICDALGRTRYCPWQDGKLNIANLPAGIYYVSDGSRHAKFVKQ